MTRLVRSACLLATALIAQVLPGHAQDAPKPVHVLMDWFAQANQAGFWQAQIDSTANPGGLQMVVQQGGPRIQTIPQVASGQAEFGLANADDVLIARMRGAPVRAVYVALDYVPYTLLYHPSPAVKSVSDLKGHQFAVSLGFAYWEWVKKHDGLAGVREMPVSGDLSLFKTDENLVQQGYSIFLPARATDLGIPNAQFKVADLGYRPYSVLITTDALIASDPARVRATVAAMKAAWGHFMDDPTKAEQLILSMNSQVPASIQDKAVADMKAELLPKDHARLGCMTDARWTELAQQMKEVNALPAGFDPKLAYDGSGRSRHRPAACGGGAAGPGLSGCRLFLCRGPRDFRAGAKRRVRGGAAFLRLSG